MNDHAQQPVASVGEEVNDVMTSLMPWALSILLHAGVVLISVFVVWTAGSDDSGGEGEKYIVAGVSLPGREKPSLAMARPVIENADDSPTRLPRPASEKLPSVTNNRQIGDPIGKYGPGRGGPGGDGNSDTRGPAGPSGPINGWKLRSGGGGGDGGSDKGSPFDKGIGGGGDGPFVPGPVGTHGNARKVVYVIDAGGALIDTFPIVIADLKRCIGSLNDEHEFAVVFFQNCEAKEVPVPSKGLKRGTADNRAKAMQWISQESRNVVPQGQSNPMKALRVALDYKPELIFILSTGMSGNSRFTQDKNSLLRQINEVNKRGTKISTIQFLYHDPLEKAGMTGTMESIARETGGTYKFIDARELGIE